MILSQTDLFLLADWSLQPLRSDSIHFDLKKKKEALIQNTDQYYLVFKGSLLYDYKSS